MLISIERTKYCPSCKIDKNYSLFSRNKNKYDGLQSTCKQCIKSYRACNRELHRNNQRDYASRNKDKISIKNKEYLLTDKGKMCSINNHHKRRNKEKKGDVTNIQLSELQQKAKTCYWCNKPLKNVKVHIDHYIPIKLNGEHTISNLVITCQMCNLKKHAKDPIDYANSIGRLL